MTDLGNHRIQKFDSAGTFLAAWGTYGIGTSEFDSPVGSDNKLYVSEDGNDRIQKFAISVPANTAPSTPGVPALTAISSPVDRGVFALTWAAATASEGGSITYELQHKDASDAGLSPVATVTTNAHSFATAAAKPRARGHTRFVPATEHSRAPIPVP